MSLNSSDTWRVLNGFAAGLAVFIGSLLIVHNISMGLILVTIGPFTLERVISLSRLGSILMQAERFRPLLLPIALGLGCVTGGAVFAWSRRARSGANESRRQSLFWLTAIVGVTLVAYSYRLLGLLLVPLALWLQIRYLGGHASRRHVLAAWVLAGAVSFLPVDFSFQLVDSSPHFAPAESGLFVASADELARRGEFVAVGGCVAWYYEPRWVWVW